MTIKIYGTEASRAMRPIWTAEEMGLDYELEMMPSLRVCSNQST